MPTRLARVHKAISNVKKILLPAGDAISKVHVIDMLAHNWFLGFTSFGGPTVHFQIFRELFVDKYGWLDETAYNEIFGLSQGLSGPASTKMLYVVNVMQYGFGAGVVAFFVWSLPMALASWGLALGIGSIQNELPAPVYALLSGLNSATVGIVALAAVQLSQKAITDTLTRVLVFLGATAGMLYNALWYFPVLMVAAGAITVVSDLRLVQRVYRAVFKSQRQSDGLPSESSVERLDEPTQPTSSVHSRVSAQISVLEGPPSNPEPETRRKQLIWSWKIGVSIILGFFISFVLVMVSRGIWSGQNRGFDLFANLYLAGTIIFGGGPVVIPLLREYIVTPGWVSSRDFLLGLAITQAFPGPNFNFAVYLGALAVQGSDIPATAGAVIGFVGIFAPGIWLVTGCLGVWSSIRKVQAVRACLRGIHASAVGLVFTAVYRLFQIGYLDAEVQNGGSLGRDPWWVVIIATSFVGGMHFKVAPPVAIVLGAIMGSIWYGIAR